jgi:hypothetical protein
MIVHPHPISVVSLPSLAAQQVVQPRASHYCMFICSAAFNALIDSGDLAVESC